MVSEEIYEHPIQALWRVGAYPWTLLAAAYMYLCNQLDFGHITFEKLVTVLNVMLESQHMAQ